MVIGCAFILSAYVGSSAAEPVEPLPRHGISPPRKRCRSACPATRHAASRTVTLESGWMRHAFMSPTFESTSMVASRGDVMPEPHEPALATGPHFLISLDLSPNIYSGIELAAGGLARGPVVIREGVDVSESGFYIASARSRACASSLDA